METIIGLLIFILPFVFKLIGKKLENAAQSSAPATRQPIEDWAEVLRRHLEAQHTEQVVPVQQPPMEDVTRNEAKAAVPVHAGPSVQNTKKVSKPILQEEPEKEKEKIDLKKLIVYSEIMKPKY